MSARERARVEHSLESIKTKNCKLCELLNVAGCQTIARRVGRLEK